MSATAFPCGAARESSALPVPALPRLATNRYRFIDLGRPWRVVDDSGISSGAVAAVLHDTEDLTFDLAIDFAHRFREEGDLAYARRDERAEEQWLIWAEELEIWAAKRRPAPGRVLCGVDRASGLDRTVTFSVRHGAVHADDQAVSFAALTRRG